MGLDSAVLAQVADLGVSFKDGDAFSYQVKSAEVKVLNDTQFKELIASKDCLDAMNGVPVRMVRGRIFGLRDFSIGTTTTGQLKGKVAKIGSFDVTSGIGNADISIKDPSATAFLQVISILTPPPPRSTNPTTAVQVSAVPASAASAGDTGKVYVQQDRTDSVDTRPIVASLQKSFSVAGVVEKIDTAKMPRDPQVRYFNDKDREKAEQIATELKTKGYATVEPVRLGLPAPAGQVEVWLPKNSPSAIERATVMEK